MAGYDSDSFRAEAYAMLSGLDAVMRLMHYKYNLQKIYKLSILSSPFEGFLNLKENLGTIYW